MCLRVSKIDKSYSGKTFFSVTKTKNCYRIRNGCKISVHQNSKMSRTLLFWNTSQKLRYFFETDFSRFLGGEVPFVRFPRLVSNFKELTKWKTENCAKRQIFFNVLKTQTASVIVYGSIVRQRPSPPIVYLLAASFDNPNTNRTHRWIWVSTCDFDLGFYTCDYGLGFSTSDYDLGFTSYDYDGFLYMWLRGNPNRNTDGETQIGITGGNLNHNHR